MEEVEEVGAAEARLMYWGETSPSQVVQLPDGSGLPWQLDLDLFLERMHAQTRRRGARQPSSPRSNETSDDRGGRPNRSPKIDLVLYTSPASEKSLRAIRAIQRVLELYDEAQISFAICDLSTDPDRAADDSVVFTPTLVKRGPGPRTWIVGNFDHADLLVDLLDVTGVDRKRDGRNH